MRSRIWAVELSDEAAGDFRGIIRWTRRRFGSDQATEYGRVIKAALFELRAGPGILGIRDLGEVGPGYLSLHIARHGRRGRHFLLFRFRETDRRVVGVARILHESMDLAWHVPPVDDEG
ncbi:MAG TPA: type II toxin-antitoxin system RelE/ParE family toxin [Stellaceae bacterium]|jgi:toxin ParE1/3/4